MNGTLTYCHGCGRKFESTDTRTSTWAPVGDSVVEHDWHTTCLERASKPIYKEAPTSED